MHINKKTVCKMDFPYAVCAYDIGNEHRFICATETTGMGHSFNAEGEYLGTLWTEPGGTMTVCHMGNENFLATHKFFKRFQSQNAVVSSLIKQADGSWEKHEILKLPYLHRFCVVDVEDDKYIVCGTLCDKKESFEDWSHAGGIYIAKVNDDLKEPMEAELIYHGIHKNHGMFCGIKDKKNVVIVTGVEGAFEVTIPSVKDGEWKVTQLLSTEISDIRVFDLDGDGIDELVTIEGFHGDRLKIYKLFDGEYKKVYEYPIAFGHGLWCGKIFNKESILIGYKNANGALHLLQPQIEDYWKTNDVLIDEMEQTANLDVCDAGDRFFIYAACSIGNVNIYTLEE